MDGRNSPNSPKRYKGEKDDREEHIFPSRLRIIKNLCVISTGFILLFTAYNGLSMLQSTMNQNQGIGVASQAIIYAGFFVSALLLPKYTIKRLGCKRALLISMSCYVPYIAANFYFTWLTMVPSAVLAGLAAAVLWSSNCTYLTESAELYSYWVHDEQIPNRNCHTEERDTQEASAVAEKEKIPKLETLNCKTLERLRDYNESKHTEIPCLNNVSNAFKLVGSSTGQIKTNERNIDERKKEMDESKQIEISCSNNDFNEVKLVDSCTGPNKNERNINEIRRIDESKHESKQIEISCPNNDSKEVKLVDSWIDLNKTNERNINSFNSQSQRNLFVGEGEKDETKAKEFDINSQEEHKKFLSSATARIFGFTGLAYRTSDIWSNLLSYYVLQDNIILDNVTQSGNCSCGASFCNVGSNCFDHNLAEPSRQMRNILTAASVAISLLAVLLIFLFLDELKTKEKTETFSFSLAMATCKFIRKKEALLLIPLSSYVGFNQAFYIADFTKSYIACAWGVYHVGLVTIAYGSAGGISSTVSGMLVKHIGRIPVIVAGGAINAGVNLYLLLWKPLPDEPMTFFLTAAFYGIATGIIWSQLRAYFGVIFKNDMEAAFAGFYLWDSVGYCTAFAYSNYICTYTKLYVNLAVSTLGVIGYLRTEAIYSQRINHSKS